MTKSRKDLEAIGNPDYVPMEGWQYDQMYGAMRPVDAIAAEIELRWGVAKLETLVSTETAAKFESARAKLDVALHNKDVQLVIQRAAVMQRGWKALEAEAIRLGHKPSPPELWHATAPDEYGEQELQIVIAKDNSAATLAHTDLQVYTVTEIARIVRSWQSQSLVHDVKNVFPGAEFVRASDGPLEDSKDIPF
tara:strand:- start:444 stop:1022 length:579 start_codon:yes stop_codon:yes gene_type:complete